MTNRKLNAEDVRLIHEAAANAAAGFLPGVTEVSLVAPSSVTFVSLPLSTGQRAEARISIRPLVEEVPERPTIEQLRSTAERLFNAYNETAPNPWKNYQGNDVPRWHQLTDAVGQQVQSKWIAVARAALS